MIQNLHQQIQIATLSDTNKMFVTMNVNFTLRPNKNVEKESAIYLSVFGNRERARLHLDLYCVAKDWNAVTQRLNCKTDQHRDLNLIIDNIESKVTAIKTVYRLSDRVITPKKLIEELTSGMPRVKLTAFMAMAIEEEKSSMEKGSYNRYKSILAKIKDFDDDATFSDLDLQWIEKFKKYLRGLGNVETTVNGNISVLKKFLGIAFKYGIKLRFNLDEIKVGSTKGNRSSLSPDELKRCANYYFSDYINPSYKLIIGYFLFSCMTGLRISDVQSLERKNLKDNYIQFVSTKTKKDQTIAFNLNARRIIDHDPMLFVTKFADQHINDELKKIMVLLQIQKRVTFHVARHTFATSFIRAGGSPVKLQMLLGHSSITQTMIYVNLVQAEANKDIFLLDDLF